MRHCQSALSSMLSTLIFFTATMLSSDKRFALCTTANLPLPIGFISSYLPSIIVWGCGAGSAMAVLRGVSCARLPAWICSEPLLVSYVRDMLAFIARAAAGVWRLANQNRAAPDLFV